MSIRPVANNDYAKFYYENGISGNLMANDRPAGAGPLYLRFFDGVRVDAKKPGTVTEVQGDFGTFFVKPDGSYSYQLSDAAKAYVAEGHSVRESITYKISETAGNTDVARLTVDILGPVQAGSHVLDFEGWTTETYDARATGIAAPFGQIVTIDDDTRLSFYAEGDLYALNGSVDIASWDIGDHDGLSTFQFYVDGRFFWEPNSYSDPAPGFMELETGPIEVVSFLPSFAGTMSVYLDDISYDYFPAI